MKFDFSIEFVESTGFKDPSTQSFFEYILKLQFGITKEQATKNHRKWFIKYFLR